MSFSINSMKPINYTNSMKPINYTNSMNNKLYNGIKAEIIGNNGSQYLLFHLNIGQQLYCSKGNIIYQKGKIITVEMHSDQSLVKQGLRIMTGRESYKQLVKADENGCELCVGTNFISNIYCLTIEPKKSYRISPKSFLASTMNIKFNETLGIKNIKELQGYYNIVTNTGSQNEYIWLTYYGEFKQINLQQGENIIMNNNIFLYINTDFVNNMKPIVMTQGNLMTQIFSNQGMGVQITGPCNFGIQTKQYNNFQIKAQNSNSTSSSIINSASKLIKPIGGNKTRKSRKESKNKKIKKGSRKI